METRRCVDGGGVYQLIRLGVLPVAVAGNKAEFLPRSRNVKYLVSR